MHRVEGQGTRGMHPRSCIQLNECAHPETIAIVSQCLGFCNRANARRQYTTWYAPAWGYQALLDLNITEEPLPLPGMNTCTNGVDWLGMRFTSNMNVELHEV